MWSIESEKEMFALCNAEPSKDLDSTEAPSKHETPTRLSLCPAWPCVPWKLATSSLLPFPFPLSFHCHCQFQCQFQFEFQLLVIVCHTARCGHSISLPSFLMQISCGSVSNLLITPPKKRKKKRKKIYKYIHFLIYIVCSRCFGLPVPNGNGAPFVCIVCGNRWNWATCCGLLCIIKMFKKATVFIFYTL